jgi:3-deoxy-D-manno-octulosonic-acid transferase
MKYLLQLFFWLIYFPLMRLFSLLLFWNRKLEERERFEKRNKFEWLAHSFKEIGEKADFCFEFSSEGEFQQVAPLIDDALKRGKKIELVSFLRVLRRPL